jgi:hypothetical protein
MNYKWNFLLIDKLSDILDISETVSLVAKRFDLYPIGVHLKEIGGEFLVSGL